MNDPTKKVELEDFWDEEAGRFKTTIDPQVTKKVSENMKKDFQDSLKKKSSY